MHTTVLVVPDGSDVSRASFAAAVVLAVLASFVLALAAGLGGFAVGRAGRWLVGRTAR